MDTKELILRAFLEFAAKYVPLSRAHVATLGGRGIEAKVWAELGIPVDHGWLIERNRAKSNSLIGAHRYRTHNQLGTFDRILAGHGGPDSAIDAFHLDLCGTVTRKTLASFGPLLPFIMKSTGKCLAITVADARRNIALETWPQYRSRAKRLFGDAFERVYRDVVAQQNVLPVRTDLPAFFASSFDPEKAAKRELGLLIEISEFLKKGKFRVQPTSIARYIYVSSYQRSSFRMRTYFIRLDPSSEFDPDAFMREWAGSALWFGKDSSLTQITLPQPSAPAEKGRVMRTSESPKTLAALVAVLGEPFASEYRLLRDRDQQLTSIEQTFTAIRTNGKVPEATPAPAASSRSKKKPWDEYTEQEQIEWIIGALEAKQLVTGYEWTTRAREEKIRKDFGTYNKKLPRLLGGSIAHACGKFRQKFQARIREAFGAEAGPYLDRLKALN